MTWTSLGLSSGTNHMWSEEPYWEGLFDINLGRFKILGILEHPESYAEEEYIGIDCTRSWKVSQDAVWVLWGSQLISRWLNTGPFQWVST